MLIIIVFQCLTIMKFWKDSRDFRDIQKLIWSEHFLLPPAVSPEHTVSYALYALGFSPFVLGYPTNMDCLQTLSEVLSFLVPRLLREPWATRVLIVANILIAIATMLYIVHENWNNWQ